MPRYEYKCNKCEKTFEVVHSINENIDSCESCGGDVRRVFHPVGIVFKGSGFYKTDNKSSSGRAGATAKKEHKPEKTDDNGSPKKPEKSEKTSSDSKASS
jgi:putative FmdB family regulatory protein